MSITATISELDSINKELKRVRTQIKDLSERKKELEDHILKYMEEQEKIGIEYKNVVITAQETIKRDKKNKDEKIESVKTLLKKNGMNQVSDDFVESLMNSMKGEKIKKTELKIKEKNQKKKL
jgi:predicted transcriptional regulator